MMTLVAASLVLAAAPAAAEDLTTNATVSTTVQTENGTFNYTATARERYSDSIESRWPYNATPPEDVLVGRNGQLDDAANISTVDGVAGSSAYKMDGKAHHNLTSGIDVNPERFTFSLWADWDETTTGEVRLLAVGHPTDDTYASVMLYSKDSDGDGDTDDVSAILRDGGSSTVITANNVSELANGGNLSHLVLRYNGTHAGIWVNGTEVASGASDVGIKDDNLLVGSTHDFSAPNRTIDEVRWYDAALDSSSINELHNDPLGKLDAYYPNGTLTTPNFTTSVRAEITGDYDQVSNSVVDQIVQAYDPDIDQWVPINDTLGITEPGVYTDAIKEADADAYGTFRGKIVLDANGTAADVNGSVTGTRTGGIDFTRIPPEAVGGGVLLLLVGGVAAISRYGWTIIPLVG